MKLHRVSKAQNTVLNYIFSKFINSKYEYFSSKTGSFSSVTKMLLLNSPKFKDL